MLLGQVELEVLEKSTEKIDGVVAMIMALDRAIRNENKESVYDERGIILI
jgi:phage terminase large subunit-like protein